MADRPIKIKVVKIEFDRIYLGEGRNWLYWRDFCENAISFAEPPYEDIKLQDISDLKDKDVIIMGKYVVENRNGTTSLDYPNTGTLVLNAKLTEISKEVPEEVIIP